MEQVNNNALPNEMNLSGRCANAANSCTCIGCAACAGCAVCFLLFLLEITLGPALATATAVIYTNVQQG